MANQVLLGKPWNANQYPFLLRKEKNPPQESLDFLKKSYITFLPNLLNYYPPVVGVSETIQF